MENDIQMGETKVDGVMSSPAEVVAADSPGEDPTGPVPTTVSEAVDEVEASNGAAAGDDVMVDEVRLVYSEAYGACGTPMVDEFSLKPWHVWRSTKPQHLHTIVGVVIGNIVCPLVLWYDKGHRCS